MRADFSSRVSQKKGKRIQQMQKMLKVFGLSKETTLAFFRPFFLFQTESFFAKLKKKIDFIRNSGYIIYAGYCIDFQKTSVPF
jgi:hypothetical protein